MALYERGDIVHGYRCLLIEGACVSSMECRKPDIASHDAEWIAKTLIRRYRTVLGRLYPMSQFSNKLITATRGRTNRLIWGAIR
jgi:hypothetical protein